MGTNRPCCPWSSSRDPAQISEGRATTRSGTPEEPVVASDADVGQIASALARLALDTLLQRDEFPYAAYLIGLRRAWIFEQPFDTRPIEITGEEWEEHIDASESETAEALKVLLSMAETTNAEPDSST